MSKLLLIDGSSFLHRGYYAMPNLRNSQGEYTGAVYGLVSMLSRIINAEKPQFAAVCFDKSRHSFRTDFYPEYKGTRKETPTELKSQFALAFEVLEAFGIFAVEMDNYEADDLIGTLAKKGEAQGMKVDIYTGDRDLLQLITERITVHIAGSGKSAAESTPFDTAAMIEKYGFEPCRLIDFKALMGDTSDNIPGIAGVGEKTAQKLLSQFGSLENLLQNTEQIENEKLCQKVIAGEEQARLSYRLATICCEAPIEFDEETLRLKPCREEELLQLYRRLEFRSLMRPLEKAIMAKREAEGGMLFMQQETLPAAKAKKPVQPQKAASIFDEERPFDEPQTAFKPQIFPADEAALLKKLQQAKSIGLYISYSNAAIYGEINGIGFGFADGTGYHMEFMGELDRIRLQTYKDILENPSVTKLCYNLKETMLVLAANGIKLSGADFDCALAAYLLNSTKGDYPSDEILYADAALLPAGEKTAAFAAALFPVSQKQTEELKEAGMYDLFTNMEMPLVKVLFDMEREGIVVRRAELESISAELGAQINALTAEIYQLAGTEFNINSPKQLGEILFERLDIQGGKKTKTGYSTAAEILEELAPQNEIIAKILEYRTCAKLKSTYADGLHKLINQNTGKLHTSFKQTVTATGRLSSAEPNLQNIPVRYEEGRKLRKAFTPSQTGNMLLAADYNQIELRVLAHISGDEKLIHAFRNNEDIHTRTAMEVFGVSAEEMTPDLRRKAKAVNFGIVYGISDYGLGRDLGISRKEAHEYIEKYFERYPLVKKYQQKTIADAKEKGYVETIYGRRRYLPELRSSNFNIRSFAERMAINTPIQGSAADIMKIAMLRLAKAMQEKQLRSKLLLQVHDELILDVCPEELQILADLLKNTMQEAAELAVPLLADLKIGENWYN
ncbi:MAG: DNA polymerase I, partial [Firmicutes bacterium]|nr:DNA polymerase I [Bacillota bacterium]